MTEIKQYFTINEALEDIKEELENGYNSYACDLHNEVFNTDYYIIGTLEAKQALGLYGTFDAIEEIQEYEKDNFGEIYTDLSDAEKVANMLYYIKGIEAIDTINENTEILNDNWNSEIEDNERKELIKVIDTLI